MYLNFGSHWITQIYNYLKVCQMLIAFIFFNGKDWEFKIKPIVLNLILSKYLCLSDLDLVFKNLHQLCKFSILKIVFMIKKVLMSSLTFWRKPEMCFLNNSILTTLPLSTFSLVSFTQWKISVFREFSVFS